MSQYVDSVAMITMVGKGIYGLEEDKSRQCCDGLE